MTIKGFLTIYARFVLLAVIFTLPAVAVGDDLEVHTQGGVSYVSGGVGDDELKALRAMSDRFNLKVTMVMQKGEFVSDAKVHIQDAQGQAVLDAASDGPFLLAQLPPGTYTVICTLNGKERKQTAHVGSGKQQQLIFRWTSE